MSDRVRVALRVLDTTMAEFEAWYVRRYKIDRRDFRKDMRDLIAARETRRAGKRIKQMVAFAKTVNPSAAENVRAILLGPIDITKLEETTGLRLREIMAIPDLTPEFMNVLEQLARPNIRIGKYLDLHRAFAAYLKEVVCGTHLLYRRHSTIEGLVTDVIKIRKTDTDELRCEALLCNVAEQRDAYNGVAIFDGVKVMIFLQMEDHDPNYVDTVTLAVTFEPKYKRQAAMLSGSVDKQREMLCAARAAMVKSSRKRRPSIIHAHQMSREEKELYSRLDNSKPVRTADRVLLFDNFALNAASD
jgi:hypothetical protein